MDRRECTDHEQGQTTIVMVGVIAIALLLAIAVALVGQAMVHRARARTAADAIALATVAGTDAERELSGWYASQGVVVEHYQAGIWVGSGPSQAAAWAETTPAEVQTAPALRAIVARIEQLRGEPFQTLTWTRSSFELGRDEVPAMMSMAAEFQLCAVASAASSAARQQFAPC